MECRKNEWRSNTCSSMGRIIAYFDHILWNDHSLIGFHLLSFFIFARHCVDEEKNTRVRMGYSVEICRIECVCSFWCHQYWELSFVQIISVDVENWKHCDLSTPQQQQMRNFTTKMTKMADFCYFHYLRILWKRIKIRYEVPMEQSMQYSIY